MGTVDSFIPPVMPCGSTLEIPNPSSSAIVTPTTLPQFRKLALELRNKIFRHVLPEPSHIYVEAEVVTTSTPEEWHIEYTLLEITSSYPPKTLQQIPQSRRELRQIPLLEACTESRSEYRLRINTYLTLVGGGKLYIDSQDVVYIKNLVELLRDPVFEKTMKKELWAHNVEILYFPVFSLGYDTDLNGIEEHDIWADITCGTSTGVTLMRMFPAAKRLVGVVSHCPELYEYKSQSHRDGEMLLWGNEVGNFAEAVGRLPCVEREKIEVPSMEVCWTI